MAVTAVQLIKDRGRGRTIQKGTCERENHARVKRPLTWEIIRVMEKSFGEWGIGGKIGWIGQTWTNQLLSRATELFAEKGRKLNLGLLLK